MSVVDKGSYLSRFFVKFFEILAAAIATAFSGYLVAHISGYFPSQLGDILPAQMRASMQAAPHRSSAPKAVSAVAPPTQPAPAAATPAPTPPSTTSPPTSTAAGEQRPAPQQDAATTGTLAAKKSARASHRHGRGEKAETTATAGTEPKSREGEAKSREGETKSREGETKPREGETKPRETAGTKPREGAGTKPVDDEAAVEAQVRAALAKVDANRPPPAAGQTRRATDLPAQAVAPAPRQGEGSPGVAAPPRAVEVTPQPVPQAASVQPAPVPPPVAIQAPVPIQTALPAQTAAPAQADPLTTVEIKSHPIATVDQPAPEQPAPPAEERGVLSALKHMLSDLRRPAPSSGDAPRPPAPVGE